MISESRTNNIIVKAENMADVLLKHLQEEDGCKHNLDEIVVEVFGPTLESKDQYQNCSTLSIKERVTT
jgi:hypothetical protein